jgi:hypothetical protein
MTAPPWIRHARVGPDERFALLPNEVPMVAEDSGVNSQSVVNGMPIYGILA